MYVYMYVCMFSSETTGPIESKFHMEPPWGGETKVCSNGPGHMTKMATIPIFGKKHKILFLFWSFEISDNILRNQ